MEKVTYVWKIKLSRPWTFNNDSCRLRVISHLYWWSNSEVFVDVWLFLDKSIKKKIPKEKKCVHWCGLGSIIMIWAFNSTRFVLSIPDTLLTFCFTHACLVTCKSAKKWYLMRMCISWLCPFKQPLFLKLYSRLFCCCSPTFHVHPFH